jgi:hypothetical protein
MRTERILAGGTALDRFGKDDPVPRCDTGTSSVHLWFGVGGCSPRPRAHGDRYRSDRDLRWHAPGLVGAASLRCRVSQLAGSDLLPALLSVAERGGARASS